MLSTPAVPRFDGSGLKAVKDFVGYKFKAISGNAHAIHSYIATRKGVKVHGVYDWQRAKYKERVI